MGVELVVARGLENRAVGVQAAAREVIDDDVRVRPETREVACLHLAHEVHVQVAGPNAPPQVVIDTPQLLALWLWNVILLLFILPWCIGLVWIIIDSFLG